MTTRRALLSVLAAGAAIAAVAALLWPRDARSRDAGRREELVAAMRATCMDGLLAAHSMRTRGDAEGMRVQAARMEQACAAVLARYPEMAEPHYHLGRIYRAQMRFDEALDRQERAVALERNHAGARGERALLRLRRYEERLVALAQRRGRGAPPDPRDLDDPEARRWREAALEDLRVLPASLLQGLAALLENRRGRAESCLEAAARQTPEVEETWRWRAHAARLAGDRRTAVHYFTVGHDRDRGYSPHLEGRALAQFEEAQQLERDGADPGPSYAAAISDYEKARQLDPARAATWIACADTRVTWACYKMGRGEDGSALLREAIEEYDGAAGRDRAVADVVRERVGECRRLAAGH